LTSLLDQNARQRSQYRETHSGEDDELADEVENAEIEFELQFQDLSNKAKQRAMT